MRKPIIALLASFSIFSMAGSAMANDMNSEMKDTMHEGKSMVSGEAKKHMDSMKSDMKSDMKHMKSEEHMDDMDSKMNKMEKKKKKTKREHNKHHHDKNESNKMESEKELESTK